MMNESYDWWAAQVSAEIAADETETGLAARDNEAYRRDFPEIDRWEDEGGRTVETTKFGDDEIISIRFYGRKTLGELIDEQIDLAQPVSEDTQVSVAGEGRYMVIVVVGADE